MPDAITSVNFVEWGNQASKNFLEDGVEMNSTISKLAEENDLLPHQIQRVCEIANHRTYSELFKTAKDKTFKFDMADPAKVIGSLESDVSEKIATDYLSAPKASVQIDALKMFGLSEISNEPDVRESIKQAGIAIEMMQGAIEELKSRSVALDHQIESERENLYKIAKEMVISGTELMDIWQAARELDGDEKVAADFGRMVLRMTREGLMGAANQYLMSKNAEAVSEELISKRLSALAKPTGVRVVNGRHPIMISLNTLADYRTQRAKAQVAIQNLSEKSVAVRSKMEELGKSVKLDKFVSDEQADKA